MSTGPIEGGRPLLRGKVLGFPVHLDLSFVIVMAVLGWYPGVTATGLIVWLVITPIAVLVHELGHAVVARTTGARPQIALAGFGGVTTYAVPREITRLRSIAISLAGPAVGLVIGGVLIALNRTVWSDLQSEWAFEAVRIGIWTCVGWSVLNLLPVLPLDGGQAMQQMLPGNPEARLRRAAAVSLVVAVVAAVAVYHYFEGTLFLTFFLAFFAISNFLTLRSLTRPGPAEAGGSPAARAGATPEQVVIDLLWSGQSDQARQVMQSLPEGTVIDLALHGAVLSLTGDPHQGHALLEQEAVRRPGDPNLAAILALTQALEHDWDALIHTIQGPFGPLVPQPVIERAVAEARGVGREDVAGRLSVLRMQ